MRKFGDCLQALEQFQLQMANQMNIMLVSPIDQFLQKEVGKVKALPPSFLPIFFILYLLR